MLERPKAAALRLVIVSNRYKWLRGELERPGIAKYSETIVISEEAGVEKPDPEILNIALRDLSLAARECIYAGACPCDVLCAGRSGMDCAWIVSPYAALPDDSFHRMRKYFDASDKARSVRKLSPDGACRAHVTWNSTQLPPGLTAGFRAFYSKP